MRENGAPGRNRTHNPLVRSQVLYPLSYGGNLSQLLWQLYASTATEKHLQEEYTTF
ncbi:uncharacterized protein METZ01_LOCUS221054 [marine metagenome]|uniref:Uncharacterized protein n=1 Tax=marine metagenome TaxID=408172 RepID=A0A382FYZ7_9ZZZZ